MEPERWRHVSGVLEEAIALQPVERKAFLDHACPDPVDRREVESLLRHHDQGTDFMEDGAGRLAAELLEPEGLTPGQRLGVYRIVREIGRGGMGVVYLARDATLDRDVAIKMLPPDVSHDARRRERLRQEARAAAAVSHPGIAHIYALEEDEHGAGYLVSEFVAGRTLREEIAAGPIPPALALGTATQVASAVAAAHARGVVHRDLKPENIMRTGDGTVKVLDFGLARLSTGADGPPARLTVTGAAMGTPGYMSPEQLRGADTGPPTDIFSLGLLIHEMLTGRHAFAGDTDSATVTMVRIIEASPGRLPAAVTSALPGIDAVVDRCLLKDPAARYATAEALVADLRAVGSGAGVVGTRAEPASRTIDRRTDRQATPASGWWQFHQVTVSALYVAMIYPAWEVRGAPIPSWAHNVLFVLVIVAAALATTMRLHGVFTARVHPDRLAAARRRARPWARRFDWMMSGALLLAAAIALVRDRVWFAALFATVAASATVAFLLIEPATSEATFGEETP